ncbi:Hsp70 family protein [Candidatus Nomurabacteria bacterium]|nr:Hsp70 family protein [Candidatus Nomurabacteria bacterium]
MKTVFGIDFGTKNSALAIGREGRVEIANVSGFQKGNGTIPSAIYFHPNGEVFVGQDAIDEYMYNNHEGRLFRAVKSLLKNERKGFYLINKKPYSLEQLIGLLLRVIKQRGEEIVQEQINDVVIGRPVIFSDNKEMDKAAERRLTDAAISAGFKNVVFVFEPVAAALAFQQSEQTNGEQIVLICDIGGGTSDFAIIKLPASTDVFNISKYSILSLGGAYIGGDDFDSDIMQTKMIKYYGADAQVLGESNEWLPVPHSLYLSLCRWHLIPDLRESKTREIISQIRSRCNDLEALRRFEDLVDSNYGYELFQQIEVAKVAVSSNSESKIMFREGLSDIKETLTRTDFEKAIKNRVTEMNLCVEQTISDAGISVANIDKIFITGGSSQIPIIRQLFLEKFGEEKVVQNDVLTAVARGLGIHATRL